MDLLLDTHVMLGLAEPEHFPLPPAFESALDAHDGHFFVSNASLWEMAIKHRQGRLPLPVPLSEWPTMMFITGLHLLDITTSHVLADLDPVPDTKDPFDRLLLAIAAAEGMQLATIDTELRDHPHAWRP